MKIFILIKEILFVNILFFKKGIRSAIIYIYIFVHNFNLQYFLLLFYNFSTFVITNFNNHIKINITKLISIQMLVNTNTFSN